MDDGDGAVALSVVPRLRRAGCVWAEDEAALLVDSAGDPAALESMLRRRCAGEPLEHVLGRAEFCGLGLAVTPGVFVPRRRSEFLVRQGVGDAPPRPLVVDLCCGSGALGLVIAAATDARELHLADIDPVATACARRNGAAAGAQVHTGDLFAALPDELRGRVDVLVVNAPYVPTAEIELMPQDARIGTPRAAVDGGPDGLDVHRRVAAGAAAWLAPAGRVLIEVARHQGAAATAMFTAAGLRAHVVTGGEATVVVASRR